MKNWSVEPNDGVIVRNGHIELPPNTTDEDITYTIVCEDEECATSTTCVVRACEGCKAQNIVETQEK